LGASGLGLRVYRSLEKPIICGSSVQIVAAKVSSIQLPWVKLALKKRIAAHSVGTGLEWRKT